MRALATNSENLKLSYDGLSDFVKDWMKSNGEQLEDLEKELDKATR